MGWTVYNSDGQILQSAGVSDNAITTAKILDDAVTVAKLANSINTDIDANTAKTGITSGQASAITANTAKVTNATHSGEVTGATALTIAADAVTTVKILDANVTNAKVATGIDAVKLADGSVTNTELQYINTLGSNAQVQISAKAAVGSGTPSTQTLPDTAATGSSTEAARLDHIHAMPTVAAGATSWVAGETTEGSTTSNTPAEILDVSGLTIGEAVPFFIQGNARKGSNQGDGGIGLRLNSTIVDAPKGGGGSWISADSAYAQDGIFEIEYGGRDTNYLNCCKASMQARKTSTGDSSNAIDPCTDALESAVTPTGAINDIDIMAKSGITGGANVVAVDHLHIYTRAVS